jgi:hypothetical protein
MMNAQTRKSKYVRNHGQPSRQKRCDKGAVLPVSIGGFGGKNLRNTHHFTEEEI